MKYVPALDGIRCFAVLIVALFHFGSFGAGWVGVQMFFVLSGFLITSILIDSKERHRDNYFRRFYWRRTLRIFPLYFAYLGLTALGYLSFGKPRDFAPLWGYLLTYTSNFAGMGATDVGGPFYGHFWSLAVEEQFYLVWPLLVFFLSRNALKRATIVTLIGAPILRLLLGAWLTTRGLQEEHITRVLGALPLTQLDSFGAGAAVLLFGTKAARPERLIVVGLSLWIMAGLAMLSSPFGRDRWRLDSLGHVPSTMVNYYHVWGLTATNLAAAAVILAALCGAFAWLFQNVVTTYVGRVSYGVYVLHLPLLAILQQSVAYNSKSLAGIVIFVVYFSGVVAVAGVSYRLFESRFLQMKDLVDRVAHD